MTTRLDLDLASTPFSRRGSYLAVSRLADGVFLRTVRGNVRERDLVRILVDGDAAPAAVARPGLLSLRSGGTEVELALAGSGRALVRVTGGSAVLDLQVGSQYDVVLRERADVWRFVASGANRNYRLAVTGSARLET
ncbi:MAG: hypothetical protein J0H73_04695, partial [Salana multivorans]|nr:hypothetical protein [Salana multivorans]